MRKLGVEECAVRVVQSMYIGAKSRVKINNQLSDEFGVNVGVHQGSVLKFCYLGDVVSRWRL